MTANEQLEDQIPTLKRGYFSRHWRPCKLKRVNTSVANQT